MLEGWENYFVLMGTAAASLIGLLFVVVTLTHGHERSHVLRGQALYMTPTAIHFGVVLSASAIVLTPKLTVHVVAGLIGLAALWGEFKAVRSTLGILQLRRSDDPPHWTDLWCYGVGPALAYFALLGIAAAIWAAAPWSIDALVALLLALMLTALRNAWDLITWIAPRRDTPPA
ncbi:MAG TPA: hypothetical protein VMT68_16060 [Caulobacteraceae bacterium]|nr:hypothetical protein [Caulobacteraceae bacterium]